MEENIIPKKLGTKKDAATMTTHQGIDKVYDTVNTEEHLQPNVCDGIDTVEITVTSSCDNSEEQSRSLQIDRISNRYRRKVKPTVFYNDKICCSSVKVNPSKVEVIEPRGDCCYVYNVRSAGHYSAIHKPRRLGVCELKLTHNVFDHRNNFPGGTRVTIFSKSALNDLINKTSNNEETDNDSEEMFHDSNEK